MIFPHILLLGAVSLAAGTDLTLRSNRSPETLRKTFATARAAELPQDVARRVAQEKAANREDRCIELVRVAVEARPAAM